MHRKVAAALVAALALGVASCGGSEPLTRAQLVRQLETACRQAQERAEEAGRSARGEGGFFEAVLAGQRVLVERVEGLEPPDELRDDVDTLESGLAERTDLVAEVAQAGRAEQQRLMAEATRRMETVTRDIDGALRRLGVEGCN